MQLQYKIRMDEIVIPGRDSERESVKLFQAQYGAPAYVRRARRVEEAYENLLARCRKQRDDWLRFVRLQVGILHALAGEWTSLRPLLCDEEDQVFLETLHAELAPSLRAPPAVTRSRRVLRRALVELNDCIAAFNARWQRLLDEVDLSEINVLRDGYNRYYLLEKECAVRSPRLARQGFRRLEPLTREELIAQVPPLRLVRLAK